MTDTTVLTVLFTAIGAVIGSFLNVCIYRVPRGKSIVWPASACESCARELSWYENMPVVSWSVLGGKCRTCKAPLSIRHPLIEALTAAMFGVAMWHYGPSVQLLAQLVFGCALIVLFAIDLEHHLLPNVITLPGIVVGFAFSFVTGPGWLASLVGIVLGHMLFRAPFTATSMIGFIALAGIIVRNSILLVDFIRHTRSADKSLRETLLEAGMIRFKPIVLTAAAAMIGAAVILTDPIFQGLAISLLFGLASSTLLTVLVIPAIYIVLRDDGRPLPEPEE